MMSCGVQAARLAEAKQAHLCGMAAKLAYESPLAIADAVTRWGFTFLTDQKVGPSCLCMQSGMNKAEGAPRIRVIDDGWCQVCLASHSAG
jgi:hypothetical protein